MARMSTSERAALDALRAAADDASTAPAFAARALAILQDVLHFDEGYILAVDPESLLFTRLLAYRGDRFPRFVHWLRDVCLIVERRVLPEVAFPALLRHGGGLVVLHERTDRWIGSIPPPADAEQWRVNWRQSGSPAGGGFRVGFADRGRWIAAMQAGRWEPGEGFRQHDVDLLRRAAPTIARALRQRLEPTSRWVGGDVAPPPDAGHLLFGPDRRPAFVDATGEEWIERLPEDGMAPHGMSVPVAAQSLVNDLASDAAPEASVRLVDRHGFGVLVRATRAAPIGEGRGAPVARAWIHVTIRADPVASRLATGSLTARQREVGLAVARGARDQAIAAELGIAETTVHEHVRALHAAFGTSSRAELVAALASV